jgi:hypothetical protein
MRPQFASKAPTNGTVSDEDWMVLLNDAVVGRIHRSGLQWRWTTIGLPVPPGRVYGGMALTREAARAALKAEIEVLLSALPDLARYLDQR